MGGELAHVALAFQGAPAGSPQALALAVAAKGTTTNLNTNTNLNSHLYFTTRSVTPHIVSVTEIQNKQIIRNNFISVSGTTIIPIPYPIHYRNCITLTTLLISISPVNHLCTSDT